MLATTVEIVLICAERSHPGTQECLEPRGRIQCPLVTAGKTEAPRKAVGQLLKQVRPLNLADGGSLLLVEGSSSASTQVKFSLKDAAFPGRHTTISLVKTSQLTQTPVTEIGWGRKGGHPRT